MNQSECRNIGGAEGVLSKSANDTMLFLTNEKRQMLVNYFNHRDMAAAVSQRQSLHGRRNLEHHHDNGLRSHDHHDNGLRSHDHHHDNGLRSHDHHDNGLRSRDHYHDNGLRSHDHHHDNGLRSHDCHDYFSHVFTRREWSQPTEHYPPVVRRRHHTTGEDRRPLSLDIDQFQSTDHYHGNQINRHQKDGHYKSCNAIGSNLSTHNNHQLYQACSTHHITDSSCSNYGKRNYSSPNIAISSQGLEYICNFKSTAHYPYKISNQINGASLIQTRSAQDLPTINYHGNHSTVRSATYYSAVDHNKRYPRRRRKHKNCTIM